MTSPSDTNKPLEPPMESIIVTPQELLIMSTHINVLRCSLELLVTNMTQFYNRAKLKKGAE